MTDDSRHSITDDGEPAEPVRQRRKGIYVLPNAITLAALFAGFYAIVSNWPPSASSWLRCSTAWTAAWRA